MSRRTTLASGAPLGLCLGGVLVGHMLTYDLLLPDAHLRADTLAATGHAYQHAANGLGVAAVVFALAAVFLQGVLGMTDVRGRDLVCRLAGFQISAFLAMEVIERLTAHAGPAHLGAVFLIGVPAQAFVAVGISGLVALALRAGRAMMGSPRERVWARPAIVLLAPTTDVVRGTDGYRRALGRAPPVPAV